MTLTSELYTAEVLQKEKAREQTAREERVRKMLVDFIDKVCRDLYPDEQCSIFDKREEVVDILELWVTKRRTWL